MLERLFRRLGSRYVLFVVAGTFPFCAVANITAVLAVAIEFQATPRQFVFLAAEALAITATSIVLTFAIERRRLRPVFEWLDGHRTQEIAIAAWNALGSRIHRFIWTGYVVFSIAFAAFPLELIAMLHQPRWAYLPDLAGIQIAIWWAAILGLLWIETAGRPLLREFAESLPADFVPSSRTPSTQAKIFVSVTVFAAANIVFIGALMTLAHSPAARLALSIVLGVVASASVAAIGNFFLTRSVRSSVSDLNDAARRVERGDLATLVPRVSADEFGDLALAFNKMIRGLSERQALQSALGSYVDPIIAERLLTEGESLRSEDVDATVVFLDIRGFTTISERLEPGMIVRYLNMFFARIVPIVSSRGGHVNRFTGDGLVAVFGTPEHHDDHADRAVDAVREIARVADELYGAASMIGIGVNSGRVIAGTVGGGGHLEFTVMGDVVNVASRVQEHTKTTHDTILITGETKARMERDIDFETRGEIAVRGRTGPVDVFAVPFKDETAEYGWETWTWDRTLFAGAAQYYERGRLPYAPGLADAMRDALHLDGTGRLLDVGCGPGTIAARVSHLFAEMVGIDPDEEMIEEAHRRPIPNARFVTMRAEDLPDELGAFDVITFAASFHWMDRPKVASIVREMLRPDGAIVQIDAPAYRNEVAIRRFEHPLVPWHEIIELRKRYLGPHQRAGQSFRNTSPSGEDEVFRAAGFLPAVEIRVPDGRILDRTIDDVVANVFSSSSTAPHLFADRLGRFETDLRAILSAHAPAGLFSVALPANRLRIWRLP